MKHLCLGKHPCHYYVDAVCRRCGKLSRGRRLGVRNQPSALACQRDSYLETLEDFRDFCRGRALNFKATAAAAMRHYIQQWSNHG